MSSENIQLKAETRQPGKHSSRAHRRDQQIPAVIYGPKVENMNIYVSEIELTKYNKKKFENTIFVLNSPDKGLNALKVLKKDVDFHPVSRRPTHVDFYALDMTKVVRVEVELRFEGKSIGIKEGGLLNITRRTLEVECLPTDIPEFYVVDISALGLGDSLHASDVTTTGDVKVITLPTETICTIVAAAEEEAAPVVAAADAAAPAAAGAAPAAAGAAAPAAGAPAAGAKAAAPAAEKKK